MKLLVCISKTPDTTSKISFDSTGRKFVEDGVQFILNPYDEWYALVRALELKEQLGGQVDVVHVGTSSSDIIIRKALAIGADAAYRIDAEPTDSWFCAQQIAHFVRDNAYDIILLGKETIDYNGSEVGAILAGILDLPLLSHANKLEWMGSSARVQVEIEGGVEIFEVQTPFVLSASKGLAEQRIPNMKGIMDAKKKPLEVLPAQPVESLVEWVRFELPAAKTQVEMIAPDDVDRLVAVLKDELKLI